MKNDTGYSFKQNDGTMIEMTNDEFHNLVDLFALLRNWDLEEKAKVNPKSDIEAQHQKTLK